MIPSYSLTIADEQLICEQPQPLQWHQLVSCYQRYFQQQQATSWLLFEPDCFYFSALFFALLSSHKAIVLPQNGQPGHLQEIASQGHRLVNASLVASA